MHERRNFVLVLGVAACALWAIVAWFVLGPAAPFIAVQRAGSVLGLVVLGALLAYALAFEDRLPDLLAREVGPIYYEVDGVSFMPTVRRLGDRAELCLYYQNRFENPAQVVVHLRPAEGGFRIRPGARDVHLAFRVGGGDFGVVRQPIAVAPEFQGEVVEIELAAACLYPRSHGARWRSRSGLEVGTLTIDWSGAAFRTGLHEVCGEIDLVSPTKIHLSLPTAIADSIAPQETWRQECVAIGDEDR